MTKKHVNKFIKPTGFLECKTHLVTEVYLAKKHSGYYNYGRTTWHVYKMQWIVGDFTFEELDEEMRRIGSREEANRYRGAEIDGKSYYGIVTEIVGEMSKREARKLLQGESS